MDSEFCTSSSFVILIIIKLISALLCDTDCTYKYDHASCYVDSLQPHDLDRVQFSKFVTEVILSKGMTVLDSKKLILSELRKQSRVTVPLNR